MGPTTQLLPSRKMRAEALFNIVQGLPADYAVQYNPTSIRLIAVQQPLQLTGAVSRKMHGALGPFDVNLLTTDPVECRSSGGNHTLVLTFNNIVTSGSASVTTGTGTVSGTPAFSGQTVTIDLVGVSDMQKLVVTLHNVTDRFSQVLPDTPITVNMLIGDTTGNKLVNASDISQTKLRSGSATTASNFREDVTVNGTISASDISLVKSRTGAGLPLSIVAETKVVHYFLAGSYSSPNGRGNKPVSPTLPWRHPITLGLRNRRNLWTKFFPIHAGSFDTETLQNCLCLAPRERW